MRYALAVAVLISGVAVGQELPRDTNELTTLTVKQAKALAERKGGLDLDSLTTLSDEVAHVLSQHKGNLSLNGLAALSGESARALAQHEGLILSLDGLSTLSDEAAVELAQYRGRRLVLNGLENLSDKAAEALQQLPDVELPGRFRWTPVGKGSVIQVEYARMMVPQHRDVFLPLQKWQALAPGAADVLCRHRGPGMNLSDVSRIGVRDATALAKYEGTLGLDGLTSLSDEAASSLATYKGRRLSLGGLATLSDEAAAALRANPKIDLPAKFKR